ncbi:MAG: lytic transglycosylase domain-containing protein [Rubrobacteridae bacterium]|nr:lytic transglycosylase domain-containing protein [Rubrobacteridae bacterium]
MKILKVIGLSLLIAIIAMFVTQNGRSDYWGKLNYPLEYKEEIAAVSKKYGLDPYLVCAIIYAESKFDPASESSAGAIGLMQIMPETGYWAASKKGEKFSEKDLANPSVNIDIGSWYYKYLTEKYKNDKLALAAYNSGFKNVDKWIAQSKGSSVDVLVENIPFQETRDFVSRVIEAKQKYKIIYGDEFK